MQEILIGRTEAGGRLDKFLARYFREADQGFLYRMLRKKNILLNGGRAAGSERLKEGDVVKVFFSDETFSKMKGAAKAPRASSKSLDIIFENEDIMIINKPAGLLSQKANKEDDSLTDRVAAYILGGRLSDDFGFIPSVANRLDRNTSGLVMAGKTLPGQQFLSWMLRSGHMEKTYLCLVHGTLSKTLDSSLYWSKDEKSNLVSIHKEATDGSSLIRLIASPLENLSGGVQLLKVNLISGKGHQIRAQLAYLGMPVLGDKKYGNTDADRILSEKIKMPLKHQLLHAFRLSFSSGPDAKELSEQAAALAIKMEKRSFEAPVPPHFGRVLNALGGEYGQSART